MTRPSLKWMRRVNPEAHPDLTKVTEEMNAQQLALFGQWVINGRNISKAAREVGYHESYARRLFATNPVFQAAKRKLVGILTEEDREWIDLIPQAKRTMLSLLNSDDDRVKFLAAKDIVDRGEGKPVARIDHTVKDERAMMSEGQMQLAFSLMKEMQYTFAQAREFILSNPDEAEAWIRENVKAPVIPEIPAKTEDYGDVVDDPDWDFDDE